jgi:hypothetical protein
VDLSEGLLASGIPRQMVFFVQPTVRDSQPDLIVNLFSLLTPSGPNGQTLTTLLGDISSGILDNPIEGRRVDFKNGALISYSFRGPPFLVYGDIYGLWKSLGEATSPLGLPIADPQLLDDGSTCSIFEGGHVHKPPGAKEVLL